MAFVRVQLPIFVPRWLYSGLKRLKRSLSPPKPGALDLSGDRDVEWSFMVAHTPDGPGKALDFGSAGGNLSLQAAQRGFQVVALDLQPQVFPWRHHDVRFLQGDMLTIDLPQNQFDLVINCSSVEHVGLVGRYSVSEARPDGDLEAMGRLRELMRPGGIQLLSIPLGRDSVFRPWHRVYGEDRLPALLKGYEIMHAEFWQKSQDYGWTICGREEALHFDSAWDDWRKIYALGCFVLRRPVEQ